MESLRVNASPTLRKQVADTLRAAIARGELQPGERLVERVLCERIGVSRTSLREALRELENEGIVTNLPNRGLIIAQLDARIAKHVFDVRASLEGLISRLFCENATDAQIAACRAAFEDVKRAYAKDASQSPIDAKTRFYDVLMEGADNPEAERMLRSIHIRVSQLRALSLSSSERRQTSLKELSSLVEAICARDCALAENLSRDHVNKAAMAALSRIE
ncbi:transcriptional regulator, GntR family [Roseovarius azorensis]|uniref:Transcriptional regulator, GntR family n=1 Tax=Roseovarius azorensis TaxID=1287727 RepID=A0A1H7Y004_9RHOB|nr:GntR family transcriptional regulator [Roseovarius azorensis]SEM39303.1 transcriptional regulator, GntR family [Roseovarius azorensis]